MCPGNQGEFTKIMYVEDKFFQLSKVMRDKRASTDHLQGFRAKWKGYGPYDGEVLALEIGTKDLNWDDRTSVKSRVAAFNWYFDCG